MHGHGIAGALWFAVRRVILLGWASICAVLAIASPAAVAAPISVPSGLSLRLNTIARKTRQTAAVIATALMSPLLSPSANAGAVTCPGSTFTEPVIQVSGNACFFTLIRPSNQEQAVSVNDVIQFENAAPIIDSFDGVSEFEVLGIDPSLRLDPDNTTAFITGLTFESAGSFTGTMTPTTAKIPEPASLTLLASGLLVLALTWRRRKVL